MDDTMFSDLTTGLQVTQESIANSGLIAEPAKVMVLVPGTRAEKAESALAKLKSYINIFIGLFILILCAVAYFIFKKKPKAEYVGTSLPGFDSKNVPDLSKVQKGAPKKAPQTAPLTAPLPAPQMERAIEGPPKIVRLDHDDIVKVEGPLPISSEDEKHDQTENRVSENDASIASIIKAREALTKEIEQFMSTGLKS